MVGYAIEIFNKERFTIKTLMRSEKKRHPNVETTMIPGRYELRG